MHDAQQPVVREVAKAVVVAALTAAATGLVNWALDALKQRAAGKPKETDET